MDTPLDLYHASRADLIDLLLAERDRSADLERRLVQQEQDLAVQRAAIAHLTERLGEALAALGGDEPASGSAPRPHGMPGHKATVPAVPTPIRKRRERGYGRRRMVPTQRRVHAYPRCPRCREPLAGGTVVRTREVIEVPVVPAVVTEHVYLARRCPHCRQQWIPGPGLAGEVVGQGRLGVGLLSLVATLREELRLPVERIQWYLQARHGLALSVGAIVGALHTVAAHAAPLVERLRTDIRGSPVLHADETGWRENGRNGYAWTFSTPQARSFVHGGRDKGMLADALGASFAGVLVSDFYGVYTSYEGRHQYCWAHLLRDVDELVSQHPDDAGVRGWADAVHRCFIRAKAEADPDPAARLRARQRCEAALLAICAPALRPAPAGTEAAPAVPQAGLCRRIEKHLGELFVFVEDPTVPPTNNAAERSLRHLVTCRKISGGTRSAAGTATKMTLASLFGTWRVQGLNPLLQCRQLLANPQV